MADSMVEVRKAKRRFNDQVSYTPKPRREPLSILMRAYRDAVMKGDKRFIWLTYAIDDILYALESGNCEMASKILEWARRVLST